MLAEFYTLRINEVEAENRALKAQLAAKDESLAQQAETIRVLRKLLWLRHGCPISALYAILEARAEEIELACPNLPRSDPWDCSHTRRAAELRAQKAEGSADKS